MIVVPPWVAAIVILFLIFLIVKWAFLSAKIRELNQIIYRLEGIDSEEVKDSELGDIESHD